MKINCPCCQSENTELRGLQEPYVMLCLDCNCRWHEEKRQPAITPEAAWDWFCERVSTAKDFKGIKTSGGEIEIQVWRNESWDSVASYSGGWLDKDLVEALGWQDMRKKGKK